MYNGIMHASVYATNFLLTLKAPLDAKRKFNINVIIYFLNEIT